MNSPNAQLMDLYGTDEYYLEKCGAIPAGALKALQVIAPTAFLMSEKKGRENQEKMLAEAEMLNQMFRQVEHERMSPIMESLGMPPKQASAKSIELAEELGRNMAHGFEKTARNSALEKLASGVPLEELIEIEKQAIGFLGGIAKFLGGAAKSMGGTLGRTVGKATTAAGSKAKGVGARMTRASTPVVGRSQTATQTITRAPKGTSSAYRGAPDPKTVSTGSSSAAQDVRRLPAKAKPAGAAAAPAAATEAAEGTVKKKPLIGWKTKAQIGLGAGALGVGYVGLKGAQATRDYMMMPSHATRYGQYGPSPAAGVSRYGYATPRY